MSFQLLSTHFQPSKYTIRGVLSEKCRKGQLWKFIMSIVKCCNFTNLYTFRKRWTVIKRICVKLIHIAINSKELWFRQFITMFESFPAVFSTYYFIVLSTERFFVFCGFLECVGDFSGCPFKLSGLLYSIQYFSKGSDAQLGEQW